MQRFKNEDELTEIEQQYLHGSCHLFAIKISQLYGFPLHLLVDFDEDIQSPVLVHAYNITNDNQAIDVRGSFDFSDLSQKSAFFGEFEELTSFQHIPPNSSILWLHQHMPPKDWLNPTSKEQFDIYAIIKSLVQRNILPDIGFYR